MRQCATRNIFKKDTAMPNSTNKEYVEHKIIDRLAGENPSLKDVADGVRMIYSSLWGKEQLDDHIREIHNGLCANCSRKAKPADCVIKWAGWVILVLVAILAKVLGVNIPTLM